jgi:benzaldehyde dehydrogenase (NAD)
MGLLDPAVWTGRIGVSGWAPGEGPSITVREAATGADLGMLGGASPAQVAEAAERARQAQRAWAALPPARRSAVLRAAADVFEREAEQIVPWIVREAGSTWTKARSEILAAIAECREAAALPTHPHGQVLPSNKERWSIARRVPVGVVAVISPFNYPLTLAIRSVAPALGLGNAVLLKPDPRTSVCGGVVLHRVFEAAGLPPDVLQVLPGGADVGAAVVEAPQVRVVSFTGSTAAGRRVGEAAARLLKRVHLELGGNNAILVLPGADINRAAAAGAYGSFLHQGQVCQTAGRHLVHVSKYDDYVAALARIAASLAVGDPFRESVQIGPLIDDNQAAAVRSILAEARTAGATAVAGGEVNGRFAQPTVLRDVTTAMRAWNEEIFGPVAPVMAYHNLDEAVDLINASEYGLSVAILGDVGTALSLADRIHSGKVHINEQTINDEANVPFGGVGASGNGARFGGADANIEAFTETQWVTMRSTIEEYVLRP